MVVVCASKVPSTVRTFLKSYKRSFHNQNLNSTLLWTFLVSVVRKSQLEKSFVWSALTACLFVQVNVLGKNIKSRILIDTYIRELQHIFPWYAFRGFLVNLACFNNCFMVSQQALSSFLKSFTARHDLLHDYAEVKSKKKIKNVFTNDHASNSIIAIRPLTRLKFYLAKMVS